MTAALVLLAGVVLMYGGWRVYWSEGIWCLIGMCMMGGGYLLSSLGVLSFVNLYMWGRLGL